MAKEGGSLGHEFFKEYEDLHKSLKTYVNGACLTGHRSWYVEKDSCSYRWQGLKKAKENSKIYNLDDKPEWHVDASGYRWVALESIAKDKAGSVVEYLEKGIKKGIEKQKVGIKNFTNGFVPYGNQVHHILPNAVLRDCIDTKSKEDADLKTVICQGLLEERYNINYKNNMLILPSAWSQACLLGLPKHLGSHPGYSMKIKKAVMRALKPYQAAKNSGEEHPEPKPEDLKDALERISDKMYKSIIDNRQNILKKCKSEEKSVNNLPSTVYACIRI